VNVIAFPGSARRNVAPILLAAAALWAPAGFALNPAHECDYCHGVHSAEGVPLLGEEAVEILCLTCHSPGGHPDAPAVDVHTNVSGGYAEFRATCMRCHDPHSNQENWLGLHTHPDGTEWDGINLKLVGRDGADYLAMIATLEWDSAAGIYLDGSRYVVFEQLGTSTQSDALKIHSFADGDMDGNGVKDGPCEVCHSQTDFHCNEDADNTGACSTRHHLGETCTNCHDHAGNFMPPNTTGRR
jgi:predicted CXXCH cytochrome family protein